MIKKLKKMKQKRKALRPFKQITIELNTNCNFKCKMCPHDTIKSEILKPEEVDVRLDYIKKFVKQYSIISPVGMGEPFLNPYIVESLTLIKNKLKNPIHLNTNCSISFVDKIYMLDFSDVITLSINASNKEMHKEISGTDKFDLVIDNAIDFLNKNDRPRAVLQLMDMSDSDMIELKNIFLPHIKHGDTFYNRKLLNWALDLGNPVPVERYPCISLWVNFVVDVGGNIYPCCCALNRSVEANELLIGKIDTVTPKLYLKKIKELRKLKSLPEICEKCDFWSFGYNYWK